MKQKVLLMILDGWGIGNRSKGDVISTVHPAYISAMTEKYPHAQLHTDGENVGLPDGQMGNSEVGHLNIGAGRIVYQDLVKINRACKDGSIMQNPEIVSAYSYAKENGKKLHLMGLTSDGGVHSSLDHLFKLIDKHKPAVRVQLAHNRGRDLELFAAAHAVQSVPVVRQFAVFHG